MELVAGIIAYGLIIAVTWFQLRDQPAARSFYQSGLYFNRGTDLRNA